MLQINKEYAAVIPGSQERLRRFRVEGRLGAGAIADVFRVVEIGTAEKREYAAKLAREPQNDRTVDEEYEVLLKIEKAYSRLLPGHSIPVPTGNELVRFYIDDERESPVLLMKVIEHPELFDVYRERQRAAVTPDQVLAVEKLAWIAARQYVQLLDVSLRERIVSGDRKRDTFLWDDAQQQLLVVDWNVTTSEESSMSNALKVFAQNWFTLFTRNRPQVPPWYQDDKWGNITIQGRHLLSNLMSSYHESVKPVLDQIDYILALIESDEAKLEQRVSQIETRWRNRAGDQSRKALEQQFRPDLCILDLVRRWKPDDTRTSKLWMEMIEEFTALGEEIDTSNPRTAVRKLAESFEHGQMLPSYQKVVEEMLKILDNRTTAERVSHIVNGLLDDLRGFNPNDDNAQEKLDQIERQVEFLQERLPREIVLRRVKGIITIFKGILASHDLLAQGEIAPAIAQVEQLKAQQIQYPDVFEAFGMDHKSIDDLLAELRNIRDANVHLSPLSQIRQELLRASGSIPKLEALQKRWLGMYEAASSVFERDLLTDYLKYSKCLLNAHQSYFAPTPTLIGLIYDLANLQSIFPEREMTENIRSSQVVTTLIDYYLRLKEQIGQVLGDDTYLIVQARDINNLLALLFTNG